MVHDAQSLVNVICERPLPDLKMACDIFPRSSFSLFYFFDIMILNALMMMILMIPRCASRQQLRCAQLRARHKRMSGLGNFSFHKVYMQSDRILET